MPNTFFGLTIGVSGLYASQASINTVAHNVSNENTPGYTRQKVETTASEAISLNSPYGMAGTGVDATGVVQIRNEYYDKKYRTNNSLYGNYEAKEYYMKSIENYFSETNAEGITSSFDQFFTSVLALISDTGNATIRSQVTNNAQTFTEMVNNIASGLKGIQQEANTEIRTIADRINAIAEQIATLNKQINTIEITGRKANDLRDSRNLLLDELSEYCKITTEEDPMGDAGIYNFSIRIDGKCLVDGYDYSTLKPVPQSTSVNMNDEEGLYDLTWSDGQSFDGYTDRLGGKLQALFEVRDGNNQMNFTGTGGNAAAGATSIEVTAGSASRENFNDLIKLNIPQSNGRITVGSEEYTYESFEVEITEKKDDAGNVLKDEAGNIIYDYKYTFQLKDGEKLRTSADGKTVSIGESLDYKGIPYYMARLNEFVRTVSREFNRVHDSGKNQYGNITGLDFFTAVQETSGADYDFTEEIIGAGQTTGTFRSVCASNPDGTVILDANGNVPNGSYYYMTCMNFGVSKDIMADPKKISAGTGELDENGELADDASDRLTEDDKAGIEHNKTLWALYGVYKDNTLFKQGDPSDFLRTLITDIAIDGRKAKTFTDGQNNILKSIDSQRKSISGVDSDEEAMDLMQFRYAYNLSSHVISVMNEVYNKLINETGV